MKKTIILTRQITERTKYKAHRFKVKQEYIIQVGGEIIAANTDQLPTNPRLKVPFKALLITQSKKTLAEFADNLGRSNDSKWLKAECMAILEAVR